MHAFFEGKKAGDAYARKSGAGTHIPHPLPHF
jgi:hypothetical protein